MERQRKDKTTDWSTVGGADGIDRDITTKKQGKKKKEGEVVQGTHASCN
jgi:hypothetical protein